jgi:hypothetical protein
MSVNLPPSSQHNQQILPLPSPTSIPLNTETQLFINQGELCCRFSTAWRLLPFFSQLGRAMHFVLIILSGHQSMPQEGM